MTTGGMPHHNEPSGVDVEACGQLGNEPIPGNDIGKRSGPTAAIVSNQTVLKIPASDPFRGQRSAQVASVHEVVLVAPKTSVDVHDDGMRAIPFWQPQIAELFGV